MTGIDIVRAELIAEDPRTALLDKCESLEAERLDTYDAMVLRLGRKDHAVRAVAKRLERRGLPLVRSRSRAPSNRLHYRITALGFRVLKGEA